MRTPGRKRAAGFTFGELMTTVLVLVIIAAIALPSYRGVIRTARLTTQIHDFSGALNLARSEAVKRGISVSVCPRTPDETTTMTCGPDGTPWRSGWVVFVDKNNIPTNNTGEETLRASSALASGYSLRGTPSTTLDKSVTMNPKGQVSDSGYFILCENEERNPSRAVLVNNVGRITIAQDRDDNGIPEYHKVSDGTYPDIPNC